MPEIKEYEIWDGKRVLGYFQLNGFLSNRIVIPMESDFKRPYGRKLITIEVPLIYRKVSETYSDITMRLVLDVRKKSAKQKQALIKLGRRPI